MKHLVVIPDGVTSKRMSAVEMARRLRHAGYRITLIGKGGDYKKIDEFDYSRLDLKPDLRTSGSQTAHVPGLRDQGVDNVPQVADNHGIHQHPFHLLLEKISPDLLLIDVEMHEFVLAAIASNYPVALFSVFFNMRKHRSMPPLHYDIVPGRGVAGFSFMIELAWLRFRLSKFISNTRRKMSLGGEDKVSRLENYAADLGLRLADHVDYYQWLIPFLYKSLPVLVLNPFEMEFPFPPDRAISYVGPMICLDRSNLNFLPNPVETNHDIVNLLDSYRQNRDGRRLVYCSFGCFFGGNDLEFWHKLVKALRNTDWDVIFAFGNRLKPEALGQTPSNIRCLDFAPQMDILTVADCAVIHAGMTTVYECILCEVPMVVYPFKVNDQMGTAARVVYHHIGVRGSREKDSSADIRNHVERAMHDPELKENLAQMRKHVEKYQNNDAIAEVVERILENAGEGS
jgi:hypothetical protein